MAAVCACTFTEWVGSPELTAVDREGVVLSGMIKYFPGVIDCIALEPIDWLVE